MLKIDVIPFYDTYLIKVTYKSKGYCVYRYDHKYDTLMLAHIRYNTGDVVEFDFDGKKYYVSKVITYKGNVLT